MRELTGHTTPESAYLVDDYPYGFRLRTSIRYWIETRAGHGQRVVSQTRNPKRPGQPWNQPHASTYSALRVLFLDEQGHVGNTGLGSWADEAAIRAFMAAWPQTCADERNARTLQLLIAHHRASAHVRYTVSSGEGVEPRQTPAEQIAILRKLTILELAKLRAAAE